jgi:hypothetical protein
MLNRSQCLFVLAMASAGCSNSMTGSGPTLFPTAVNTGFDDSGKYTVPIAVSDATGVVWTSSDPSVATVSGNDTVGTVTGLKVGTATITATAGGSSATATVTVQSYKVVDKNAGQTSYSTSNCAMSGCHDSTGPDITPSGIGKHTDAQIFNAVSMGANPEGGDIAIGKAAHSFSSAPTGISAYLRSLTPAGIPHADQ